MITISKLNQAEQEIQNLLNQNETNWKDVAKIAITVREKQLFKQSEIKSFTAWVNAVAKKCDRQPSLIWRYIKAAKYYMQTIGSDNVEEVDKAIAAPEALVNLEKVERNAPLPVFEKLKEKVLAGEATVKETREIEQEYRPIDAPNRRGRPAKEKEGSYEHLGLSKAKEEVGEGSVLEIKDLPRNQIAASISRSLRINLVNWTKTCSSMHYPPKHYKEHTEVRVNFERQRLRLDFMAVVRWSYKKPKDIFAVEIKSSLSDFQSDRKWENYLNFCHYFCFAIPKHDAELRKAIEDNTDSEVGILEVDFESGVKENMGYLVDVFRRPSKLKPDSVSLVYETLYERVLNWSGSDRKGKNLVPAINLSEYKKELAIAYSETGWNKRSWSNMMLEAFGTTEVSENIDLELLLKVAKSKQERDRFSN